MKLILSFLVTLGLVACAGPEPERYKFIPVTVTKTKTKTVTKYVPRECPPLPPFPENASSQNDLTKWSITVVRLYKECAK